MKWITKSKLKSLSLRRKIIFIYLCSIGGVCLAFTVALNIIVTINHKMLYHSIAGALSYSAHDMNGILKSVEESAMQIFADTLIQDNLRIIKNNTMMEEQQNQNTNVAMTSLSKKSIYSRLTNYLHNSDYITYISILTDESSITAHTYQAQYSEDEFSQMVEKSKSLQGQPAWFTSTANGIFLVQTIREIDSLSLCPLGTLILQIDMDKLVADLISFNSLFDNSAILLLNQNELLYMSPDFRQLPPPDNLQSSNEYKIVDWNHRKYFTVIRNIKDTPITLACLVPYTQILDSMIKVYTLTYCTVFVVIGIVLFVSLKLIHNIMKHFQRIIQKIDEFDGENFTLSQTDDKDSERGDELGLIDKHFDLMAKKIETLINDNYRKQILVKEAQIKALETQINPHFLYNTLNTINWKARMAGEHEISSIVEALGTLLRTALKEDTGIHTISKELTLVESYITIQQVRFGSRLHFHSLIDPALTDMPIPKMTIQPLVENAIKYSVEVNTEASNIYVEICSSVNKILIYVKNDGSQFENKPYEKKPEGSGIGLVNINSRIKLMFGEEYGLSLYNENELAIALITIPRENHRLEN